MAEPQTILPNFYDHTLPELEAYLVDLGHKKFRAQQLFRWVYGLRELNPEKMTNLSLSFRQEIPKILRFDRPAVLQHLKSVDGTQKFLFSVGEWDSVETVLIPSEGRLTLCVSSQVGCNMACKFCFTAKQKLKKKLKVSEIVGQFLGAQEYLNEGERITNIVFMGMGEPLDNPENVFPAIEVLHNTWGLNLSKKKITVSTSGLVDRIPLVTQSGVRLAVSLNGINDEVRSQIMPINKKWPLKELLEACRTHSRLAKDKVTLEYILLKDLTDSLNDARKLHKLAQSLPCKINIIPFNEHPGSDYKRPSEEQVQSFQKELIRLGTHVLRRKTMGDDIYAACGQLNSMANSEKTV